MSILFFFFYRNGGLLGLILKNFEGMMDKFILKFGCIEFLEKKTGFVKKFVDRKLSVAESSRIKKKIPTHMTVNTNQRIASHSKQDFEVWATKPLENLHMIKETLSLRKVAAMKSNSTSSRGHILLQFTLNKKERDKNNKVATLSIFDFAGNEDYATSERRDETKLVNLQNSSLINIIRSFITYTRNNEVKTDFSSLIKKVIKESSSVVMIIHSSHEPEAVRSSKFLLQQISSTVYMKKKSKFFINKTMILSPEFKKGDNIQVVYGNDVFDTNIIGIISNGRETYFKVHYFQWSSLWEEWISPTRIK